MPVLVFCRTIWDVADILFRLADFGCHSIGLLKARLHPSLHILLPTCSSVDSHIGSSFPPQGLFVQLVQANSPSALAGLRFGDQILQINGQNCAGWSTDKGHKALKAAAETRIELVVRDR